MPPPVSSNGGLSNEINYAIEGMKILKVTGLKEICRRIGLPLSGRKVNLQERITRYLRDSMSIGHIDPWRPKAIVILISQIEKGEEVMSYLDVWADVRSGKYPVSITQILGDISVPTTHPSNTTTTPTNNTTTKPTTNNIQSSQTKTENQKKTLNDTVPFRLSPFHNLQMQVVKSSYRLVKAAGRGVGAVRFTFTGNEWLKLQSDSKKYRLCLFCWPATSSHHYNNHKEFITFPSPNEILFNGNKITENVRGLKNKPGTAKPADLTTFIRPPPQVNTLDLIYAFTSHDFQMACYVTEIISPDELLQTVVLKHPKISRKSTMQYIKKTMNEEDEDELITTSTVLSLQCPISYTRMKYPAQSRLCKHLQCFDALWYLHSQMQVPTWQCPVCSVHIPLENLVISEYVDDILKNSDEEIEQVELSPDGSWKPFIEEETPVPGHSNNGTHKTDGESPVKKELTNGDMNDIPHKEDNNNTNEPLVISLDSSDDEDGGNDMVTTNQSSGAVGPSEAAPPPSATREPITRSDIRPVERTESNTEADLPLSQYIRRNSTNMLNGVVPSLGSESLLGLGNNIQLQNGSNVPHPSRGEPVPNVSPTRDGNHRSSLPSLVSSSMSLLPTPSLPPNIPPVSNSSLFVSPQNNNRPPPLMNNNSNSSLLGIGGNLPPLNLGRNPQLPVNPFISNNNLNSTQPSACPLPPIANSTDINARPIAVPHSRNPSSRRNRSEVSPFIPRKPYPVPNSLPQKRRDVDRGDTMLTTNNNNYPDGIPINPLTNRPYQSGTHGNNIAPVRLEPTSNSVIANNNSNDSDIIDLTSD